MGGKGGGGGGEPGWAPYYRAEQEKIAKAKAAQDAKDLADKTAAEEAAKAEAAANAKAEKEAAEAAAAAEKTAAETLAEEEAAAAKLKAETPIGDAIGAGGGIEQPAADANAPVAGAADILGGAVVQPPKYWVGGVNDYETASQTGKGAGAIKTIK